MKPFIYKVLLLFFITGSSIAQTKNVILKESFKADENTVLNLDLDNVAIILEESFDGKIHFDYKIIFGKYNRRKREQILKGIKVKAKKNNNKVDLTVNNSMYLGIHHKTYYSLDSLKVAFKEFLKYEKSKKNNHKTKDSIFNEIRDSEGDNLSDFLIKNEENYKDATFFKQRNVHAKIFIIKAPKDVTIRLKALHSNIIFKYNILKPFVMNSFKGVFKFKEIKGKENRIIASNGIFQAEKVTNTRIEFLDMSKVVIGEVTNVEFATETSKVEIGEIRENVNFTDFNSKIFLYNFSNNFHQFKYKGDYSKMFLFNIKDANYSLNVFGHKTALNMNNVTTTFGISKEKKLDKILEKNVKEGTISEGNIAIELRNGILNIK